ncbi:hypothetical protein LSH36_292g03022 [Paralvinella palmiformis]|uniref:Uncharacterized protein n=1 Tax=Paralvinella palmiformis TaxID=53620 RepID=A0AAD9JJF7_9ANNE|nr:hypothetical protein LSH36_292g03022 [Paralvinella palmiformis]
MAENGPTFGLTNDDLQDLHEDILDRNEDGVRGILNKFSGQGALIRKLCCTEVDLEPAAHDHMMNRRPLTAIHRAALIDSHGILDAILTSLGDVDIDIPLRRSGYTPLHVAITAGVLPAVNYLTSLGASLVAKDADGRSAMHMAAENGHKDVMTLLCVRGGSVNALTNMDRTPLHVASASGHSDVVDFLLNKGADPNGKDQDGRTPLHDAQIANNPEISYALVGRGADVNATDRTGCSPIHFWILNRRTADKGCRQQHPGPFPALSTLVNSGADVNLGDRNGDTGLHLAVDTDNLRLIEFLLNQSTDVNLVNNLGRTALFCAKSPDVARLLIQVGSAANLCDSSRNNILHVYAGSDDVTAAVLEAAIENGAEIDAQNGEGQTPLHRACAAGSREKIELLLRSGARSDILDRRNQSVLHVTLVRCEESLALWLLNRNDVNININNPDNDGNTLLHLAARFGNIEVVNFLTSRDVPVSVRNKSDQTAATLAAQGRHLDCLRLLLQRGGCIDPELGAAVLLSYVKVGDIHMVEVLLDQVSCNVVKDEYGRTALHVALERESLDMSRILLDHGADVNILDNNDRCPLHVASRHLPTLDPLLSPLVHSHLRNDFDSAGNTPLHYGIVGCRIDGLKTLVGAGCQLIRKNRAGRTAAHCLLDRSLAGGDSAPETDTAAKLEYTCTECPECVDQRDIDNNSLLHAAVRTDNIHVLQTLLRHAPAINVINNRRLTPLHCACANGNSKMASLLLDYDADPDIIDNEGRSAIFSAVLRRDTDLVLSLSRRGADINIQDPDGKTCLMVAMEMGQSGMCEEILLEIHPDVSLVDNRGRSLLHYAARYCSASVADIVLDQGADVSIQDSSMMTPLHAASANDDCDVMASLLTTDIRIDACDERGNSALHLCSERGSYNHVKQLLDRGADPEIANGVGRTAAHLAATAKDADVIELLIANEADIDVTDYDGNTPLALSIVHGNVEISSDLLDQGADASIRNASGDTVLHHATRMSHLDRKLLKLLVRRCGGCLEATNSSGQTPLEILKSRTDLDLDGIALDVGLE